MNDTKQVPCNCTACPGASCSCGCRQPAEQTARACGSKCQCSSTCACGRA